MAIYSNKGNHRFRDASKIIGIVLISVFSVLLLNLLFNVIPFLNKFFLGFFGLFSYALFTAMIVYGILLLNNKKITINRTDCILFALWLFVFICILQIATSSQYFSSYGKYLIDVYASKYTAGGLLFGIFVYPLQSLTYTLASYIILIIALVVVSAVLLDRIITQKQIKKVTLEKTQVVDDEDDVVFSNKEDFIEKPQPKFDDDIFVDDDYAIKNDIVEKTVRDKDKDKARKILGLSAEYNDESEEGPEINEDQPFNFSTAQRSGMNKTQYIKTPYNPFENNDIESDMGDRRRSFVVHDDDFDIEEQQQFTEQPRKKKEVSDSKKKALEFLQATKGQYKPMDEDKEETFDIYDKNFSMEDYKGNREKYDNANSSNNFNLFDLSDGDEDEEENELDFSSIDAEEVDYKSYSAPTQRPYTMETKSEIVRPKAYVQVDINEVSRKSQKPKRLPKPSKYNIPDTSILRDYGNSADVDKARLEMKGRTLEKTLESFRIPAKITNIIVGPAFTRYELQMPPGISVNKINPLVDNIAMSLESYGNIRTEIPIPGKNAFGIEVPNEKITTVGLREVLESDNFQLSKKPLTYALGKDIGGECRVSAIDDAPHMLIAGSTGSGKSVCLNAMLISLLFKTSPEDVRIILIDPKQVEFTLYNGVPHLLIPKVITAPDKALDAMCWCVDEMERRFSLFSQFMVRNIKEYNNLEEVKSRIQEKMPYIILVVDELADLMTNNKKEFEEKINKLAAKCRAAGIHLVLATQRPSVDVVTGTIKNNLPSRIAFAVSSFNDSRTILGEGGAENLLGKGDMLFALQGKPMSRIQGAFITNEEVNDVINWVKDNNEAYFDDEIEDKMFNRNQGLGGFEAEPTAEMFDPLMKEALRNVIKSNNVSVSKLQRMFSIGFNRAGRMVDQMEAAGYVSAKDNKNNRVIFITQQEFEEKFGEDL